MWAEFKEHKNWIRITFGPFCTDEDFDLYITKYREIYKQNRYAKVIVIFDITQLQDIPPNCVLKQIFTMREMQPIHKEQMERFFVVCKNPYILNVLELAFIICPPVSPYEIVNAVEECF